MTVVYGLLIWVFILWVCWLGLIELGKQLLEEIQWTTVSPSHDFRVKAMSELSVGRTWWWNSSIVTGIFSCAVAPLGRSLWATRKTYLFSCSLMFCFLGEARACVIDVVQWKPQVTLCLGERLWSQLWSSTVRRSYGNLWCLPACWCAKIVFLWNPECKLVSFSYAVGT